MVGKKQFSVRELKAADDDSGTFTGTLSTYGNLDLVGDVCEKGCFDSSVREQSEYPLLWNHDPDQPLGSFKVTDTDKALMVEGSFNTEVQKAREVFSFLKRKDIQGMSIGYMVENATYDEEGIRHLTKVKLMEGSIVTFPANPLASASAKALKSELPKSVRSILIKSRKVKSLSEEDRDTVLAAVDTALEQALDEIEDNYDEAGEPADDRPKVDEAIEEDEELKTFFTEGAKAIREMRKELKA